MASTSSTAQQEMLVKLSTDGVPKLFCPICNKAHVSLAGYVKHLKKHEPPGGFCCRYCDERFCSDDDLKRHLDTQHTTIICRLCKDTTFTNEDEYRLHIRDVHKGVDRQLYNCEKCGAAYKTLEPYRRHIKTECGSIKPYKCDQCEMTFVTKYNLKQHVESHSGELKYCCSYCGRNFRMKARLVEHERTHTGEKPYKCDVCGKRFSHRESIVTHSSTHTGIRLVECRCCSSRFSCHSNLIKHRRNRPETCGLPEYDPPRNRIRKYTSRIPAILNPTSEIRVVNVNKIIKPDHVEKANALKKESPDKLKVKPTARKRTGGGLHIAVPTRKRGPKKKVLKKMVIEFEDSNDEEDMTWPAEDNDAVDDWERNSEEAQGAFQNTSSEREEMFTEPQRPKRSSKQLMVDDTNEDPPHANVVTIWSDDSEDDYVPDIEQDDEDDDEDSDEAVAVSKDFRLSMPSRATIKQETDELQDVTTDIEIEALNDFEFSTLEDNDESVEVKSEDDDDENNIFNEKDKILECLLNENDYRRLDNEATTQRTLKHKKQKRAAIQTFDEEHGFDEENKKRKRAANLSFDEEHGFDEQHKKRKRAANQTFDEEHGLDEQHKKRKRSANQSFDEEHGFDEQHKKRKRAAKQTLDEEHGLDEQHKKRKRTANQSFDEELGFDEEHDLYLEETEVVLVKNEGDEANYPLEDMLNVAEEEKECFVLVEDITHRFPELKTQDTIKVPRNVQPFYSKSGIIKSLMRMPGSRGKYKKGEKRQPREVPISRRAKMTGGQLKEHMKMLRKRDKVYQCGECIKMYYMRKPYERHLREDHKKSDEEIRKLFKDEDTHNLTGDDVYKCHICDKIYLMRKRLQDHIPKHGPDGSLIHKCPCYCAIYFATRDEAQSHAQVMHRSQLWCEICEKFMTGCDALKSHRMRIHGENKDDLKWRRNLVCDKCGKKFMGRTQLTDHVRSDCGRVPIYQCQVCGKCLTTAGILKTHMLLHQEDRPFQCEQCGKSFKIKAQYKTHTRFAHSDEKRFKCHLCPKAYPYRESLLTHMAVHTGIKRFLCNGCGKRFTCVSNLQAHRKVHSETCGLLPLNAKATQYMGVQKGTLLLGSKPEPGLDYLESQTLVAKEVYTPESALLHDISTRVIQPSGTLSGGMPLNCTTGDITLL